MGPLILAPLGKSLVCRLLKHLRLDQIFDQQNLYLISWSLPSGALTAWSFLSQRSNVALHWHLDPLMFAVWRLLWSLEKAWFNFDSGHKHFYMRHTLYKWLPLAEGLSVPLMGPLLPTSCRGSKCPLWWVHYYLPLAVSLRLLMILAAYACPLSRCTHLFTILKAPLFTG